MKKLMITAAVALAAVVSQAAQIDWAQTAKDAFKWQDNTTGGGHTVYLVQFTAATEEAAITASATLYNNLKSGDTKIASVTSSAIGSTTTKTGMNASKIDVTGTSHASLTEGAIAYYALFMTTTGADEKDYFMLSSVSIGQAYDPNGEIEKEGMKATFVGSSFGSAETRNGWTKVSASDVPEPTSGLLLLLGVAGLALRRRRA